MQSLSGLGPPGLRKNKVAAPQRMFNSKQLKPHHTTHYSLLYTLTVVGVSSSDQRQQTGRYKTTTSKYYFYYVTSHHDPSCMFGALPILSCLLETGSQLTDTLTQYQHFASVSRFAATHSLLTQLCTVTVAGKQVSLASHLDTMAEQSTVATQLNWSPFGRSHPIKFSR